MERGRRNIKPKHNISILKSRDMRGETRLQRLGIGKWDSRYIKMVYEIALLGASNPEIAGILNVTTTTLDNWRVRFPEFEIALLKGKERADGKIALALYNRAKGYSHPDVHISNYKGEVTITPIIKYYPPDTTAAKFWLTNRQPDKWKDMARMEDNSKHLHLHQNIPLSDISTEELEIMERVGMKRLMNDHKRKN